MPKTMQNDIKMPVIKTSSIILLGFLLTSTGWLSWEYHLINYVSAHDCDIYTMVIGYLLQAVGMMVVMLIQKHNQRMQRGIFIGALFLHMLFMIPAVVSPYLVGILIFGFLMNIMCGMIAGCYLWELAQEVPSNRKGSTFGIGYSLSIFASWILSLLDGGSIYYSKGVIVLCVVMTLVLLRIIWDKKEVKEEIVVSSTASLKKIFQNVAILVLLFSIVTNSGFAFPVADISHSVNIEFSRLVYAIGLLIAGILTDYDRKYGAILALVALMIPFVILALRGETISSIIFWVLNYFTFGFYSVYRVIVFSDLASTHKRMYLAGIGLLIGRIGDAIGEAICIGLNKHTILLVLFTAVLFLLAVIVFFHVYNELYIPKAKTEMSEKERFQHFASQHDLSTREQDVLLKLLAKKSNGEIAQELFITENTVKFHVKNLLQKTGCKNRADLIKVYITE